VFEFPCYAAGIGEPHAGMVLMSRAGRWLPFILPGIPEEV